MATDSPLSETGSAPDSVRGRAILMLSHFVGMIDLVALPVWMGALVQHFGFNLEQAGMIVTAFLLGAVAASLTVAPLFNRLPRKLLVTAGYGVAAVAFLLASSVTDIRALIPQIGRASCRERVL